MPTSMAPTPSLDNGSTGLAEESTTSARRFPHRTRAVRFEEKGAFTEAAIGDAMERLMHGRTTFMIAHRLGTLETCALRLELDQRRHVGAWPLAPQVGGGRLATLPVRRSWEAGS
jgi:hypothetical protein